MKRRTLILALDAAALTVIIVLVIYYLQVFQEARFELVNRSAAPVVVVAAWSGQTKEMGSVAASGTMAFEVDGEGAIRLRARFPDGREIESEQTYFSAGMLLVGDISDARFGLAHDLESRGASDPGRE